MRAELTLDSRIVRVVELALLEDVGMGDLTSEAILTEKSIGTGEIICKGAGVIAGLEVAALVFRHCDPTITMDAALSDGETISQGMVVARVHGGARGILTAERTALNFLQRMSGIATLTRKFVEAVVGTHARITDTRKTVPGLRVLDKLAVRLGGGVNHRYGLDDMVLIKDNHIVAAGGISAAVERVRRSLSAHNLQVPVEVETKTVDEVQEALGCDGVARIMLDNFNLESMKRAVEIINGRIDVEASGNVSLETVRAIAETGVDFISIGALTHSATALDLSLELTTHVQ